MPEATEQGSHPNPKPATQAQAGASGNRSGSRGGRGGHKTTNKPQNQESHQHRHGGSRRPPPGIGAEEHGRGSHHGRNQEAGGNQRHSDASQTVGKRSGSDQRGSAPQGDASSARAHHQFHSKSQSARPSEGEQTPPRGKPPGQPQIAAKFLPPTEQKSQVNRVEADQKASSSPPASQPTEAFENPPAEPNFADPSIVEQKEAGAPPSVEEQQRHAQQLHIQMQQQQFIQQLALAQQLYFQQFQQQAVQRMAAMMAAQQVQRQQQEESVSKHSEEERPSDAISEKDPPEEHSVDRHDEGVAVGETQTLGLHSVQSDPAMPVPGSNQEMVSDEVAERELARQLDMFMKEQGLVTGNDLAGKMTDNFMVRAPEGQQFYEPPSRNPNGSDLVHPPYTQEQSVYSVANEGYKVDPSLAMPNVSDMSTFPHTNPSHEQSFFTQPGHSSDNAMGVSHLIGATGPLHPRPPVEDELAIQLQGTHSYSTSPPLQPTASTGYNGQSNTLPFDFGHDPTGHPFTGFSDHSSEHSWLGDGEPQFASLATEPTGFEAVNTTRLVGRGTEAPTQPDTRRQQRKSGSHKQVGGRMFFVYPVTFQPYPDSLLNQVLNGSNPVKLNEVQACFVSLVDQ